MNGKEGERVNLTRDQSLGTPGMDATNSNHNNNKRRMVRTILTLVYILKIIYIPLPSSPLHTHTPHAQDPLLNWCRASSESSVTREGVFVGAELVTWVMSVGEVGKEEGRGVCEGLLRLGVLQRVGSGEEGELFSSGARYTWTGEVVSHDLIMSAYRT